MYTAVNIFGQLTWLCWSQLLNKGQNTQHPPAASSAQASYYGQSPCKAQEEREFSFSSYNIDKIK